METRNLKINDGKVCFKGVTRWTSNNLRSTSIGGLLPLTDLVVGKILAGRLAGGGDASYKIMNISKAWVTVEVIREDARGLALKFDTKPRSIAFEPTPRANIAFRGGKDGEKAL